MEPRRVAPVLGLCALLAADAVLIGWAFRGAPAEDPSLSSTPVVRSTSPSTTADGASGTPASAVKVVPLRRTIGVLSQDEAWVAEAGTCDKPGLLWTTVDGGDTWTRHPTPGQALRVKVNSETGGWVAGGDADCELRLWETGDSGKSWSDPKSAAAAWTRDPQDDTRVHRANDTTARPCGDVSIVDLSVINEARASVLCRNGEVRSTTDGGKGWPRDFTDRGALAFGVGEIGKGVVLRTTAECTGVLAVAVDAGRPTNRDSCIEAKPAEGRMSVTAAGTGWWLVVGDLVLRSESPAGPWTRTGATLPRS